MTPRQRNEDAHTPTTDFIDALRAKRERLALVLEENDGLRDLLAQQLYPDRAHLLYELLQNAEDCGATTVEFELQPDRLLVRHDGRPFTEADFTGITAIAQGTKRDDDRTIGRFGIGFKAVFAYTATPAVRCGGDHVQIRDMVLPHRVAPVPLPQGWTQFEFPFDAPHKPAAAAHGEIAAGLRDLHPRTLLFLSHVAAVRWTVGGESGETRREQTDGHWIHLARRQGAEEPSVDHYLRFSRPVDGLPQQNVSVAWRMEPTDGEDGQRVWEPVVEPGTVSVYFPAEKEHSGLRFHIHAPFVPELSRASVRDTEENDPLFSQVAALVSESMPVFRDLGLLTVDFLATLPSRGDSIPDRYEPIRSAIIHAFQTAHLTPTQAGGHLPAGELASGDAAVKELVPDPQLPQLLGRARWAKNARQRNSPSDAFLNSLDLDHWTTERFLLKIRQDLLPWEAHPWVEHRPHSPLHAQLVRLRSAATEHLSSQTPAWHSRLIQLIHRSSKASTWRDVPFLLTAAGGLAEPGATHFPDPSVTAAYQLTTVHPGVVEGRGKDDVQRALKAMGVREIGEAELIKALLDQHYAKRDVTRPWPEHLDDLRRFMEFIAGGPDRSKLFSEHHILLGQTGGWRVPSSVVLTRLPNGDETSLASLYKADCHLSDRYEQGKISHQKVLQFALDTGARHLLAVRRQSIDWGHPDYADLVLRAPGERVTDSGINRDWTIVHLDVWLRTPSLDLARAIWRTMNQPHSSEWLTALYRRNRSSGSTFGSSTLVHLLRNAAWVPQGSGFTRPAAAEVAKLPPGFPVDSGQRWLQEVGFGANRKREQREAAARAQKAAELGFEDLAVLEEAQAFAGLPQEVRQELLRQADQRRRAAELEFPDADPPDPQRVRRKAKEAAEDAPRRGGEKRGRTVDLEGEEVRRLAHDHLREVYDDGERMWCQACQAPVPFHKLDGEPYFEAVQVMGGGVLGKHHEDNYIALCANHAAMFRFANASVEALEQLLLDADVEGGDRDIVVTLAGDDVPVRFAAKHLLRLQTLVQDREQAIA